jgi:hypothetical protein
VPLGGVPFLRLRSAVGRSNEPKLRKRNQPAPRKLHNGPLPRKQRKRLRRDRQRRLRPKQPDSAPRRRLLLSRLRAAGMPYVSVGKRKPQWRRHASRSMPLRPRRQSWLCALSSGGDILRRRGRADFFGPNRLTDAFRFCSRSVFARTTCPEIGLRDPQTRSDDTCGNKARAASWATPTRTTTRSCGRRIPRRKRVSRSLY